MPRSRDDYDEYDRSNGNPKEFRDWERGRSSSSANDDHDDDYQGAEYRREEYRSGDDRPSGGAFAFQRGRGAESPYDRALYAQDWRSQRPADYGPSRRDSGQKWQSDHGQGDYGRREFSQRDHDQNYDRPGDYGYGQRAARGFGPSRFGAAGYGTDYDRPPYGQQGYRSAGDSRDRGFLEKTGDEISSWFGDEDARRRREMDNRGKGPRGYTRSDDRIREDVNERLSDDPEVDASDIEVRVEKGEVTLSGEVDSRQAKRCAEDCVERVSGVTQVQNNLRVKSTTGTGSTATSAHTSGTSGNSGTGSGMTGARPGTAKTGSST